jgi:hypothetical protein
VPETHSDAGASPVEDTGRDLDVRAIRIGAIAIAAGILFALAASWFLMRARGPAANTPAQPFHAPAPLLQTAPQIERADYFKEKARLTGSYGWVDRQAGIARIPVDEAMRLMAARAAQSKPAAPAKGAP